MFKARFLTALVLAPLMLFGLFVLEGVAFKLFGAAVVFLAAREWAVLCGWRQWLGRYSYATLLTSSLLLVALMPTTWVLTAAVVFWGWAFWAVCRYPQQQWSTPWWLALMGGLVLLPMWSALVHLNQSGGHWWLLFLLLLVWLADTGAYVAGKRFGKRKLAPAVSPGKTWEGVAGAMLAVSLLVLIFIGSGVLSANIGALLLLSWLITLVSILGDLLESMCKRMVGVKDSGTLLPGHGGVLDRIDSLTAALPCFVAALIWLGWLVGS
ncbi:phosphatidate cytidylyltransferase [Balneatrix alpica]|uniref:Phosphatidate cytidylyltransferase n=1 Tax=Balneatrix alpica TaxID=75684 RepID=A0ABV5ZCJ4_9GAMM|nr:phosphatidate cytidylyltransferase [Balneatrix alpica]